MQQALILYNDEVNTFDHVIASLVEVCDHTLEQAEQSAMIAHYKGKCSVLEGEYSKLKAARDAMSRREMTVSIE
ncbi:MAG: ATP-dependent Clp protease adaptor ClpS [Bacteroidales bacterium]|nr:ATP-dependent Clp protease adaptor ClpS [Bacteroidales bacterium]